MQKKWQTLFTQYGFDAVARDGEFNLNRLTEHNRNLLERLLLDLEIDLHDIDAPAVTEGEWIALLEKHMDGQTGSSFSPTAIPVDKLDIYISGTVMQLNRLGYTMVYSCDGHEKRRPVIYFENMEFARMAQSVLKCVGVSTERQGVKLTFYSKRGVLPTAAGKLSLISVQQAKKISAQCDELLTKEIFETELECVLNIVGSSGNEKEIRSHVMQQLEPFVDHMTVDHVGNILAVKRFGPGPTVILNAHLDTVIDIIPGRKIMKDGQIWTSSEGILGADDRAGVNVVLATAKSVEQSTFKGTIKYIFTVGEEVGLCGAREVTKSFLWDVDMAFVVDRRGKSDIVISRGADDPFCTPEFGVALERIARQSGYKEWQTIAGGSSDTYIWAQSGIESVNLSVGYQFEHKEEEQLDVEACYGTYKYLMEILNNVRRLESVIRRVGRVG